MHRLASLAALLLAVVPDPARAEGPLRCPDDMALVPGAGPGGPVPLCLDRTEVLGARYAECVLAKDCTPATPTAHLPGANSAELEHFGRLCNADKSDRMSHPVNCVDWSQAAAYCRWRGRRLPSQAEWAWAASGGAEARPYPWGGAPPDATRLDACGPECAAMQRKDAPARRALYAASDRFPGTAPVGSYPAGDSAAGLHDLAGNVAEWTSTRPDSGQALVMGGGFMADAPALVRADAATPLPVVARLWDVGFRCVAEPRDLLASAPPPAAATRGGTTEEAAALACALRAERIFVVRCRQNCQIESKLQPPARTEDCLVQCGRQPAMTAFQLDCLEQAGFPQRR